jgi:hypothetical protein
MMKNKNKDELGKKSSSKESILKNTNTVLVSFA